MDFDGCIKAGLSAVEWVVESPFCIPSRAGLLHGNASWGQIPPSGRLGLGVGAINFPQWKGNRMGVSACKPLWVGETQKIDGTTEKKLVTKAAERSTETVVPSIMKWRLY